MPGRTEFQRGILTMGANGYEVRTTGDQGSGIRLDGAGQLLRCSALETGNVEPGTVVDADV